MIDKSKFIGRSYFVQKTASGKNDDELAKSIVEIHCESKSLGRLFGKENLITAYSIFLNNKLKFYGATTSFDELTEL